MSLLQLCLERIAEQPTREGLMAGMSPFLTDRVLELVLQDPKNQPLLAIRLWTAMRLPIFYLTIRRCLIDDRFLSAINTYKWSIKSITIESCEFDTKKYKTRLELERLDSISIVSCNSLSDKILSDIFETTIQSATLVTITNCPLVFADTVERIAKATRNHKRVISVDNNYSIIK